MATKPDELVDPKTSPGDNYIWGVSPGGAKEWRTDDSVLAGLVYFGTSNPEGVQTAPPGKFYFKTNDPKAFYIKTAGTGNTGWQELLAL